MENRTCANYRIIESVRLDARTELVIGHNPAAPAPFVCWYCYHSDDYRTGAYCTSYRGALQVLAERLTRNADCIPFGYCPEGGADA